MGWVRKLVNKENVQMTYETPSLSRSKFNEATSSRRLVNMSSRIQSNSESDGESAANDRSPPRRFNRRAFSRVFVHLEKRLRAAPGKNAFLRLKNAGRAKEIAFTKNHTSSEIHQLLVSHFPTLANLDLSR